MEDNYLRRGKGNIGEGSLAHTFKNAYKQVGIVPEEAYSGLINGNTDHNHGALCRYFKALVDANIASKKRTHSIIHLLIIYSIRIWANYQRSSLIKEKEYTPQSFTESLGLNMDNYIELTSLPTNLIMKLSHRKYPIIGKTSQCITSLWMN